LFGQHFDIWNSYKGAPRIFLWGTGGVADPEAIFDLCLILKTML